MHIYRHTHKYTLPKKIIRRCKRASIQLHMDIKNGMIVGPLCHRSSDKYIVHKCHWEYLNVVFDFLFTHSTSLFTLSCLSPSPPISLDTACSGRQRIGITKIMATSSNRFTTRTEAVSGILRASASLYRGRGMWAQTGISLCAIYKNKNKIENNSCIESRLA